MLSKSAVVVLYVMEYKGTVLTLQKSLENLNKGSISYKTFLLAILASSFIVWGLVFLNVMILGMLPQSVVAPYSITLFIVFPFLAGILSVAFYTLKYPTTKEFSVVIGSSTIFLIGLELLLFKFEGLICLLMAAPLGFAMAGLGAMCAYWFFKKSDKNDSKSNYKFFSIVFMLPLSAFFEKHDHPLPLHHVTTSIEVYAQASEVWEKVIAFPELKEPTAWWFKAGIAHPKGAVIKGKGVGAIRYCRFTTGSFVEPITHWKPPYHLGFDVLKQPPSMKELSPWGDIHPPHLNNYFQSRRGQFVLTPLANGKTRIEGTTWYTINVWPQSYWTMWSDFLVHAIHYEVLNHIKSQVERSKECRDT
ncbi:MAG: hypothetical protein ACKO37_02700 [Vampirovibrionales bacterium]